MLERCERLAAWLQPYSWMLGVLALAACIALPAAIFLLGGEQGQLLSLLAITALLWALTLGAFVRAFSVPLPQLEPDARLLDKLGAATRRAYRQFLVIVIMFLLLLVLWFSTRTIALFADSA